MSDTYSAHRTHQPVHLLPGDGAGAPSAPVMQLSGTLLRAAQARSAMCDSAGHVVPVLCLDVALDNAMRNRIHVEQPFPAGEHSACQAAARHYKAGQRITFQAPLASIALITRQASHIHIEADAAPAPAPVPAEPASADLFA